jgi:hypothetical protein
MHNYAHRAESYRHKAEEVRLMAEAMHSPEAKRLMMVISADYLHMADVMDRLALKQIHSN